MVVINHIIPIDRWCVNFKEHGTLIRDEDRRGWDCSDCVLESTGECPYLDENWDDHKEMITRY
mgnify:CR=1 FL=1